MFFVCWAAVNKAAAQLLPVEVMGGHKRMGVDILWFKKFTADKKTPWLFFHRSRASADYHNSTSFGVTNAVSYNFKSGIGMVAATQMLQAGFTIKGGVQYFKLIKDGSLFTWLVAGNNTAHHFSGDWFVLARWSPKLNEKWKWYFQAEALSTIDVENNKSLTQRVRMGLSKKRWQFGGAADFTESGKTKLAVINNIGVFIRKEF